MKNSNKTANATNKVINPELYKVLIKPIVTEKANNLADKHNQIVFQVVKSATKDDIKQAFELVFNAKVEKVSVLNVMGKQKKFGKYNGKRADWKKAYIHLAPDQKFDLASNQK